MADQNKAAAWTEELFKPYGNVDVEKISRFQQISAANLSRNWTSIPHVTHHDEAFIDVLDALRRKVQQSQADVKLTQLSFLVKALAGLLAVFPKFNASLDAAHGNLFLKKYFHIGVAVDTPRGLVVSVVQDCDKKSVPEIASEIASVTEKARTKGLSLAEMSGGCMTISSLGRDGGLGFTPIINAPEVAILGVSRIVDRPTPDGDGGVVWCKALPLSLSYDHRVINGAEAARFMTALREKLAAPDELVGDV